MSHSRIKSRAIACTIGLLLLAPLAFAEGGGSESGSAPVPRDSLAVSCDKMADALLKADAAGRSILAHQAITRPCRPIPMPLWSAIRFGKWEDSQPLDAEARGDLLALMVQNRYPEAETLAVSLLETGRWPENLPMTQAQAGKIVLGLKPALTRYRIGLLLDIYEQVPEQYIRFSVLQALDGSDRPEALLPAVDACWNDSSTVRLKALSTVAAQKEKTPDRLLARLINTLPDGPMLQWAERLGARHPSAEVSDAMRKRGSTR